MNAYKELRDAITNKLQVICEYKGYFRKVCPHVIGKKNGKEHVLTYQFGGESSSGLPIDGEWRCMQVDGIHVLRVQPGKWYSRDRHTQPQTCVDHIDIEVDYL